MKEKIVPSTWLEQDGHRLDCGPHLSGAMEARLLLDKLPVRKLPLQQVTWRGMEGIFHAGRESRRYVDDPAHGHPFLTSSDILLADLSLVSRISKKQLAATPKFVIRSGWTLITRSGTIGRMAYARPEMDGMACSEDVLRVVPDAEKIPPGYLYAYLSSRFGVPLIVGDEYGSVQRHIEPQHICNAPVPRLAADIESRAHSLVVEAGRLRLEASVSLSEASTLLRAELGAPPLVDDRNRLGQSIPSTALAQSSRFEAFFHNPLARAVDNWVLSYRGGHTTLEGLAKVFDVPPFKHIYVEADYGTAFFTSGDLFLLDRRTQKFLSSRKTKDLKKYILQRGWVLLARSGQLGGIIGRPQFADSGLAGAAASDHVIRIVPKDGAATAGFLYTYLSLPEVGYPLLVRTATGASIPALWPSYLNHLLVPLVPDDLRARLDQTVVAAFEKRIQASEKETSARAVVEGAIVTMGGS